MGNVGAAKTGKDGYDTIEWMAEQPWCNGKVGMIGGSLLGISQYLTAKEQPPQTSWKRLL